MDIEVVDRPQIIKHQKKERPAFNEAFLKIKRQAQGTMGQVMWWFKLWSEGKCELYCTKHNNGVTLRWECKPSEGLSFDVEHEVDIDTME